MTLSKQEITSTVSIIGSHYLDKPSTSAEISNLRSRLWQAAKRKNTKVSCSIEGDKFLVKVTSKE